MWINKEEIIHTSLIKLCFVFWYDFFLNIQTKLTYIVNTELSGSQSVALAPQHTKPGSELNQTGADKGEKVTTGPNPNQNKN